jgi:hypothetical protein
VIRNTSSTFHIPTPSRSWACGNRCMKPAKCEFNKTKVEYLGMIIEGKISMTLVNSGLACQCSYNGKTCSVRKQPRHLPANDLCHCPAYKAVLSPFRWWQGGRIPNLFASAGFDICNAKLQATALTTIRKAISLPSDVAFHRSMGHSFFKSKNIFVLW